MHPPKLVYSCMYSLGIKFQKTFVCDPLQCLVPFWAAKNGIKESHSLYKSDQYCQKGIIIPYYIDWNITVHFFCRIYTFGLWSVVYYWLTVLSVVDIEMSCVVIIKSLDRKEGHTGFVYTHTHVNWWCAYVLIAIWVLEHA